MHRDDEIRLRHMLDAARKAMRATEGRTRHDLDVKSAETILIHSLRGKIQANYANPSGSTIRP